MSNFSFGKLEVYQKAVLFTNRVYSISKTWPREYLFDLTNQIRRASLSISLNIAEGTSRSSKDFSGFIDMARGSCLECVALIEIASKQNLVSENTKNILIQELISLSKMLSGLKRTLTTNHELPAKRTTN